MRQAVAETNDELVGLSYLSVELPTGPDASVHAVRDVSLRIGRGQRVGIVGESGSGKSVTGRAIAGLLPQSRRVRLNGSIRIEGQEMIGAPRRAWQHVRRNVVSMVFQDPLSSLNPTMRVGKQIAEAVRPEALVGRRVHDAVTEAMTLAGLPDPVAVARRYPFELSGGMRQRVLIAIALAKRPDLIIADEPTTALDVTVQARILDTLEDSVTRLGTALIMISHDLAVVARLCDHVCVMQQGVIVEQGPTGRVFTAPEHPYTRQLLTGARDLLSVAEAAVAPAAAAN